jgi:hypothetical protein
VKQRNRVRERIILLVMDNNDINRRQKKGARVQVGKEGRNIINVDETFQCKKN